MTSTTPGGLVCVNPHCSVMSYPTIKTVCSVCNEPTKSTSTPGVVVSMPPPSYDRAGKVADGVSRVVFGGFWTIVTAVLFFGGVALLTHGKTSGLLTIGASILTAFYARYIFRGGRFRFLFW